MLTCTVPLTVWTVANRVELEYTPAQIGTATGLQERTIYYILDRFKTRGEEAAVKLKRK